MPASVTTNCADPNSHTDPFSSSACTQPSNSTVARPYSTFAYTGLAIIIALYAMSFFRRKNHLPVLGRNVIITGGSQGMGKAVALLLASMGANVAIVARDKKKLELAGAELARVVESSNFPNQKYLTISADLSSHIEAKRAVDEAEAVLGTTDILWCCAGGAKPGYFIEHDPSDFAAMVNTNYFSSVYIAHAVVKSMVANPLLASKTTSNQSSKAAQPQRKIIFTSSLIHFSPIVGYVAYSPMKSALRTLADTLRQECLLYDISVSCCFPGEIFSPGLEIENLTKPELTKKIEGADEGQTPEVVAKACLKELEKGETLVITSFVGQSARAGMWGSSPKVNKVFEILFSWIIAIAWLWVGPEQDAHVKAEKKRLITERGSR